MKNVRFILSVAALCLLVVPSCSKKSSGGSSSTPVCQIITVTDQLGSTATTYNITYNNAGQISTEQYVLSGVNITKVFTYNGSVVNIATSNGITDSIMLNSDGLIASDYNIDGADTTLTTYSYSGTELQKAVQVTNGGVPATTTYAWTNGDATSSTGSPNITYTYNTKASEKGDYWQLIQLINYGASFLKTAHQLAGYSYGTTTENINYTYDSTGKITGITGTSGASIENIGYQYTCN